jgi:hypothetical protein
MALGTGLVGGGASEEFEGKERPNCLSWPCSAPAIVSLTRLSLTLSPYWSDAQYCVIRAVKPRMLRGALWFCALFCALDRGTWR